MNPRTDHPAPPAANDAFGPGTVLAVCVVLMWTASFVLPAWAVLP